MSCIPLLEDMLQFAAFYVFTKRGTDLVFEKFVIHCCNLMTNITKCECYKPPKSTTGWLDFEPLVSDALKLNGFAL